MSPEPVLLAYQEAHAAARLARLFRIERSGALARRPPDIAARLVERRGILIEQLMQLEARRRAFAAPAPAPLDAALAALRHETAAAEDFCRELLAHLGGELDRVRGAAPASGVRGGATGRLLGSG
jgi:hypothetical protein